MAALLANMVDAELEHARLARAFQDSAMDKHMSKDEIRDYAPNEKDDILYLLEEVNRTARRTFDALIVGLDLKRHCPLSTRAVPPDIRQEFSAGDGPGGRSTRL